MRAHVAGVVVERTFKLGSVVKKGKVQFRIDPAPLKADLTQLTRELTALRKALHAGQCHSCASGASHPARSALGCKTTAGL